MSNIASKAWFLHPNFTFCTLNVQQIQCQPLMHFGMRTANPKMIHFQMYRQSINLINNYQTKEEKKLTPDLLLNVGQRVRSTILRNLQNGRPLYIVDGKGASLSPKISKNYIVLSIICINRKYNVIILFYEISYVSLKIITDCHLQRIFFRYYSISLRFLYQ